MTVIDCEVSECQYNVNGICTADYVRIDIDGDCLTFVEEDGEQND